MKLVVLGAVVVASLGCGRNKQQQCSDLIAAYNDVGAAVGKGVGDGTDPAVVEATAKAVEDTAGTFVAVEVADDKLKTARDDLVKAFGSYATFLRKMAGAVQDAKDPAKADLATKALENAQAETEQIMAAIGSGKQALMTECNATAQ